jgi:hypothetical protein
MIMNPHRFTIDSFHENEKGVFKVLSIKGENMLIEWETGERISTPIALQEKILARIEREAAAPLEKTTKKSATAVEISFSGLLASDFKDDVTGTHWRSRAQLGGAVTSQLAAHEPFQSWSIYRRPEVHWAVIGRYQADAAWLQAKFFIRLKEALGMYGFYIERSSDLSAPRIDWLFLLNWLAQESNAAWLHRTMTELHMEMFDPYPLTEADAFQRQILPHDNGWRVLHPDETEEFLPLNQISDYLAKLPEGNWLNLVIGRQRRAQELVAAGVHAAVEIAAAFQALLPIYRNQLVLAE